MNDLCAMTGYSRDQLRGLLSVLPECGAGAGRARKATEYSIEDATLVAVCCRLEQRYGLKRDMVAAVADELSSAMTSPRQGRVQHLIFNFDPPRVFANGRTGDVEDGLIMPVGPVYEAMEEHLIPARMRLRGFN